MWETFQLLGRRRGSFQARRFTKQDDYVKNRLWTSQRGEVTRIQTHTHTQIDQQDTYFAVDSSSYLVFKSKSSA